MEDPVSIIAVVTAAIKSTKSLYETVKRFQDRQITLRRLQHELGDLANVLTQVINAETSVMVLLQGPIDRCSQVCSEFEQSMKVFSGNSKTGFRDWTQMKFMGGDMNGFIDNIGGTQNITSSFSCIKSMRKYRHLLLKKA
ncbi:hypothetical protein VE00_09923 [Pseudogymnoascus sp. WSF 3629]|nr:hypothetical protein VE00_09923 [Pseudogymnoascus sp. WSF 3629]